MAELNGEVKKLRRGELCGTASAVFCGAILIYFAVLFPLGGALRLTALISAPVMLTAGIALSAFCTVRYGGAIEKHIKRYIRDVFAENAQALHPEKKSLTFRVTAEASCFTVAVNGYKENIVLDFSALGRLMPMRRAFVAGEIQNCLTSAFLKLYERGGEYTDVAFEEKRSGKTVPVIKDGIPDKKALKRYLKNK